MATSDQLKAAFAALQALATAIKDLGSIPSGHLYAQVSCVMTIGDYDAAIRTLCNAGVIRRDASHLLHWNIEA